MSIKNTLKNNKNLRRIVKKVKIKREYGVDYKSFTKFYNEAGDNPLQIEYKILLLAHSLEKGMCHKELRPFGETKVLELKNLIVNYNKCTANLNSTAINIGYSILIEWTKIYREHGWTERAIYKTIDEFIKNKPKNVNAVKVGAEKHSIKNITGFSNLDYLAAIKTRRSVREFEKKEIKKIDLEYCTKAAIASPSACNRQMCKIYYISDTERKKKLEKVIMGLSGFDREAVNLFVITFEIPAFSFYGERNQGFFNAGLFAMNFANALHFRGIGSCFLQWGNTSATEKEIKRNLDIPENEKIAVVLGAGYYKNESLIPVSHRKTIQETLRIR